MNTFSYLKRKPHRLLFDSRLEELLLHCLKLKTHLEPQTTIYKWLFQLDDSKSLHGKWLFNQTSIYKWLFGVPGTGLYLCVNTPESEAFDTTMTSIEIACERAHGTFIDDGSLGMHHLRKNNTAHFDGCTFTPFTP